MNYMIFDTETTGIGKQDEVIQFSSVVLDDSFNIVDVQNKYFITEVEIHPEASKVNGLTSKKLEQLSNNEVFEDFALNYKYLNGDVPCVYIGHNVSFDIRLINQTLNRQGLDSLKFGPSVSKTSKVADNTTCNICTMKTLAKTYRDPNSKSRGNTVKLSYLYMKVFEDNFDLYSDEDKYKLKLKHDKKIQAVSAKLSRAFGLEDTFDFQAHNALFDVVQTLLVFTKLKRVFI